MRATVRAEDFHPLTNVKLVRHDDILYKPMDETMDLPFPFPVKRNIRMAEKMNGKMPHHRKSNLFRRRMSSVPLLAIRGEDKHSRLRTVHIAAATRAKMLALCNDTAAMTINRKQFAPGIRRLLHRLHPPILQKVISFFSTLSLQAIVEIPAKRFACANQKASVKVAIFFVRQCQRRGRITSISAMKEIIGGANDPRILARSADNPKNEVAEPCLHA